jgi:hypothetical protein
MARTTIGFGIVMIILGLGAYFGTGRESMTAMIPSFFGIVVVVCGAAALKPGAAKPALITAGVLSVLAVLGIAGRLVPAAMEDGLTVDAATITQIVFAIVAAALAALVFARLPKKKPAA